MKTLIVGGAGYIGGYLADYLSKSHSITVYDNLTYESRFLKNVDFIYGDVRDQNKLLGILPRYDAVVWLAAVVGDGACAIDPELSKAINTDSVKWLVDNYSGLIIFTSTCSVYGINNDLIDELANSNPLSIYASTKLAAEQYIVKNHKNYLVFRLGTLFGTGDEHARIRLDLVVNIMAKRAVYGEVLNVNGGEQWRPLLHVKDVSTAIEFGIENDVRGLYNLHYCNLKIHEIAQIISDVIPGATVQHQDMKFEDQRNYRVSSEKFRQHGWTPKYTIQYGVKEIADILRGGRIKNVNDAVYSNVAYIGGAFKESK